jgi:hypothetical protein
VTPSSTVFINNLLSTAMAMLSINGKLLTIAIVSTVPNGKKHLYGFGRLLVDQRQLLVNCATAKFYQELATSQIMKNRRNTSGELHYKARHDLM